MKRRLVPDAAAGLGFWFGHTPHSDTAPVIGTGPLYAVAILDASRGAGGMVKFRIPAGTEMIRLDVEMRPGDVGRAFAGSVTPRGVEVWREDPVRVEQRGVSVRRAGLDSGAGAGAGLVCDSALERRGNRRVWGI